MFDHTFYMYIPFQSEDEVKAQKRQLTQSTSPPAPTPNTQESSEFSQLRQRPVQTETTAADSECTHPTTVPVPQAPTSNQTLFSPIQNTRTLPPQRSNGQVSLVLIWLIILALVVLLTRRLYLTYTSSSN